MTTCTITYAIRRLIVLLTVLSAGSVSLSAAVTVVTGKVTDMEDRRPVEFANVAALDAEGRIAAICATDRDGMFSLRVHKEGKYRLNISFLGYAVYERIVECAGEAIELGEIRLKRSSEEIDAAQVTDRSPIRKEADRIVYDVLADPDAWRLNMSEFMSKIPGLEKSPRDGKLEYDNVAVTKVLVNEKNSPLINAARQYPMNFIRADYMSKIELVLPGSPEYGNDTPVLLITLDRELPLGAAAEIDAEASSSNSYSVSPDAVANIPVMSVGVNYRFNFTGNPATGTRTERTVYDDAASGAAVPLSVRESEDMSQTESQSHRIGVNLFRSFFKEHLDVTFSMNTDYSRSETRSESSSIETVSDGTRTESGSSSANTNVSPFRFNAGMEASYSWDRSNMLGFRYTYYNRYSSTDEYLDYVPDGSQVHNFGTSSAKEHNAELSLRLRPKKRTGTWSFNTSAGYIFRDYDDRDTYGSGYTGGLDYVQGVAYLRGSFSGSLAGRKLMYGLSINLEHVGSRGQNLGSGSPLDYNEFNIVPGASMIWRASRTTRISAGYSCHNRRPSQEYLDPYVDSSDPYNITAGNPDLKGELTHHARASITQNLPWKWFDNISLDGSYRITGNAIERVSTTNADNVTTTTYMNIGRKQLSQIGLSMLFRPARKVTVKLSGQAGNSSYSISDTQDNSYWSFSMNEMCVARLKWFVIIQNFRLTPTLTSAQTRGFRMDPQLSFGISRYWEKIRLTTSIGCDDILHGRSPRQSIIGGENFMQTMLSQRLGRSVYFSINWSIGKFRNTPNVQHRPYDFDTE